MARIATIQSTCRWIKVTWLIGFILRWPCVLYAMFKWIATYKIGTHVFDSPWFWVLSWCLFIGSVMQGYAKAARWYYNK